MTEVNIKTWIPPTASLKNNIEFTGMEISIIFPVLFFLLHLNPSLSLFFLWSPQISNNVLCYFWYFCEERTVFHKDAPLAKHFLTSRAQQHTRLLYMHTYSHFHHRQVSTHNKYDTVTGRWLKTSLSNTQLALSRAGTSRIGNTTESR